MFKRSPGLLTVPSTEAGRKTTVSMGTRLTISYLKTKPGKDGFVCLGVQVVKKVLSLYAKAYQEKDKRNPWRYVPMCLRVLSRVMEHALPWLQ